MIILLTLVSLLTLLSLSDSWQVVVIKQKEYWWRRSSATWRRSTPSYVYGSNGDGNEEGFELDLEQNSVYKEITLAQLQLICAKYKLSTSGKKANLIQRIQDYVIEQTSKSDDDVFYFTSEDIRAKKKSNEATIAVQPHQELSSTNNSASTTPQPDLSDGTLPISFNEKGQKVVTFYDSEDRNDLTSFAATTATNTNNGPSSSVLGVFQDSTSTTTTADTASTMNNPKFFPGKSTKQWEKEMEQAKEALQELIGTLLAMTGAPGFVDEFGKGLNPFDEDDDNNDDDDISDTVYLTSSAAAASAMAASTRRSISAFSSNCWSGFNPSNVKAELLEKFSNFIRANSGQVLKEVIREYELQAIGHDGKAADNVDKGGGHYREVQKVASFLDGFRKAEVRRIARTTATIILNTVVAEGAGGLDTCLSNMVHGDHEGELNEALIEYFNDLIRSQEQKVESEKAKLQKAIEDDDEYNRDTKQEYYNSIIGKEEVGEDGEIIETIDVNDPVIWGQIEQELNNTISEGDNLAGDVTAVSPSEQLLHLLQLVRERIKVEATFHGNDDRTKNLKLLAYCLKAKSDQEIEVMISNSLGSSLDVSFCYIPKKRWFIGSLLHKNK
jgi:hypothetical protein